MMHATCPSCSKNIEEVITDVVRVKSDLPIRKAITFRCPGCGTIVGCQADPIAMQHEITQSIEEAFRRRGML